MTDEQEAEILHRLDALEASDRRLTANTAQHHEDIRKILRAVKVHGLAIELMAHDYGLDPVEEEPG